RFYAAFACLCVVNLICALDATSISVALPTMAKALHGTGVEAFWAGTSFLLAATVFQPTFATLSNEFGRKPMLLIALSFFTIGSVIGGVARNFTDLLVGRSIQGVGGGGIAAMTNILVCDLVPLKDRAKWLGLITMQWSIGSVSGPVIGGTLAEKASWRWIFWLNLPFCGVAFIMIPLFLKLQPKPGRFFDKMKQIDWVGSFLFVASTTSLLIPITWGGTLYPWISPHTLVPLLLSLLGFLLFTLWSRYLSPRPILPSTLFLTPTSLANYVSIITHGLFLWSVLFYMPLYFSAAKRLSPISSGIALFPWTFTIAPGAVVVGLLINRTSRYIWALNLGWATTTLGVGLMILFAPDTPAKMWIPLAVVSGLGLGILYPAMSICNQAAARAEDTAAAAALNPFFRNMGQMLGVAVGGSVVQNQLHARLANSATAVVVANAGTWSRDAEALVEVIRGMGMGGAEGVVRMELVGAYCGALRSLWVVIAVLAGVAGVGSAVCVRGYGLGRELETD
ncbi:MFS general substrate transporter, partial [Saccharata proteae CBS 121410]